LIGIFTGIRAQVIPRYGLKAVPQSLPGFVLRRWTFWWFFDVHRDLYGGYISDALLIVGI